MPVSTQRDLRIEIREAVEECLILMRTVKFAMIGTRDRAQSRDARIDIGALAKFVDEADAAMGRLDTLLDDLLANAEPTPKVLRERFEEALLALEFYADPANWRTTPRKPVSVAAADGGAIALARLEEIEGRAGETSERSDG